MSSDCLGNISMNLGVPKKTFCFILATFAAVLIVLAVIAIIFLLILEPGPLTDQDSETLVWAEEFDILNEATWQHLVTGWRGGNHEFQYYRDDRRNSFVRDGVLYIKPTLTADELGEEFINSGQINLTEKGCEVDMNIDGGCLM